MRAGQSALSAAGSEVIDMRSPWAVTLVIFAASLILFWPTWSALHEYWSASNRYSHGHAIVLMSAYLVFRRRDMLREAAIVAFPLGLLALALTSVIWAVAVLASVQAVHEIVLPLQIWLVALTVLGWEVARRLILPVAFLYLAIPVWESGNFVLQYLTVFVNDLLLQLARVPAFIDGNIVHLAAGSFSIDGGCSGLHYFLISIAISVFYGALFVESLKNRLLLLGLSIAIALFTNWLRVFLVILAGYLSDMQHYLVVHDHYYFGWVLYVFAMVPFVLVARRLEGAGEASRVFASAERLTARTTSSRSNVVVAALCGLLLVSTATLVYVRTSATEVFDGDLSVPQGDGGWVRLEEGGGSWRPEFKGADAEALAVYRSPDGIVTLYVNLYRGQAERKEVIGYENRLEGSEGWIASDSGHRQIASVSGTGWQVREMSLTSRIGTGRLLWYWYYVNDRHLTQPYLTKFYYGIDAITDVPDAGIQVLSAECGVTCNEARELLESWLAVYLPDGPGRPFAVGDEQGVRRAP